MSMTMSDRTHVYSTCTQVCVSLSVNTFVCVHNYIVHVIFIRLPTWEIWVILPRRKPTQSWSRAAQHAN